MMKTPKVLLVDDDEILLQRLVIPVLEAGYEVRCAIDGAAALKELQQDFMSIVIMDRDMPGMDGLALCRSIRRETWPGYVYLLLLTAHDGEQDVLLGLQAGADDYVSKRISDAQLIARLSTATRVLTLEHSLRAALDQRQRMAERLQQISDNIPAMISYWDRDGVCQFANTATFDRFGLPSDKVVGMSIEEILGASYEGEKRNRVEAALLGERQLFEHSSKSIDGTVRHWQSEYVPHRQNGQVHGIYALVLNITDRKNDQEKLARQEAMLAATSRMAEIGGWELHRGAAGPNWSEMVYRIHEVPVGQDLELGAVLDFYPPDARRVVEEKINAAFELKKPFDLVLPIVTRTGRNRWVRFIGEPHVVSGQVVHISGAFQDVTQQKQIEAELAQAQKLESIGQLSAGIAHEINTPAQFIGDNICFLKDSVGELMALITQARRIVKIAAGGVIDNAALVTAMQSVDLEYFAEEMPRAIEQSTEGIQRIQRIVGAMKEFSHPATDKTLMDLNRGINSTIIVASNEWKYVAEVRTDFDENLPHVHVMPGSFNQVILNMIVNAAQAISEAVEAEPAGRRSKGTITVSTRHVDDWAEIRIQDTGCGIPEKCRERIFDQFYTTKPVGKGTGQGLAIAHDVIVKKHGGMIAVASQIGIGTTFTLRLPIVVERLDAVVVAA